MKSFSLIQSGPAIRNWRKPARRGAEVRLEDALELEDAACRRSPRSQRSFAVMPASSQAIRHGIGREACVALLPGESLLRRRCDDLAVPEQGRGAVVVVRGDAEDMDWLRQGNDPVV